jgi:hypothetical protein
MSTQVSALSCLSSRFVLTSKNGITVLHVRKNNFTDAVSNSAKTFMSSFSVLIVNDSCCLYLVSTGYYLSFEMLIYPIRYCIPMCIWCHIPEEGTIVAVLVIQESGHCSMYSN